MPKVEEKKLTPKGKKEVAPVTATLEYKEEGSVYVEKSVTKNMGDYNSAKIVVGVTLPINPTKEILAEAKRTIDVAVELVDKEVTTQVEALLT